jgi:hypothetical protein
LRLDADDDLAARGIEPNLARASDPIAGSHGW